MSIPITTLAILAAATIGGYSPPIIDCGTWDEATQLARTPGKVYESQENPLSEELRAEVNWQLTQPDGKTFDNWATQVPYIALKTEDGWFLGTDNGEWGGALVYKSGAQSKILIQDNVEDLFYLGGKLIVTAGLAHLNQDRGAIYVVYPGESDGYGSELLYALPGSPRASYLLDSGDLYIRTGDHSHYVLSPKLQLSKVRCE